MIIDGKLVSSEIRKSLKSEVDSIKTEYNKVPGLAVIIVGNNPASEVYVRNKERACAEIGIRSLRYSLPEDISEKEILDIISELNSDPDVNGILVQLPLPKGLDENKILSSINVNKDVDGFSAYQTGRLTLGQDALTSCTPTGIMELLKYYNVDPTGKHAVVVGRSNIVGKPMSLLLLKANATVTVCHSKTKNIADITKSGDIVVVAIGKPGFLSADMIKEDAVVIDVGITRTENGLKGDVDYEEVSNKASLITPVPGGVGPMTITMLMSNTVKAFFMQNAR